MLRTGEQGLRCEWCRFANLLFLSVLQEDDLSTGYTAAVTGTDWPCPQPLLPRAALKTLAETRSTRKSRQKLAQRDCHRSLARGASLCAPSSVPAAGERWRPCLAGSKACHNVIRPDPIPRNRESARLATDSLPPWPAASHGAMLVLLRGGRPSVANTPLARESLGPIQVLLVLHPRGRHADDLSAQTGVFPRSSS